MWLKIGQNFTASMMGMPKKIKIKLSVLMMLLLTNFRHKTIEHGVSVEFLKKISIWFLEHIGIVNKLVIGIGLQ